MISQLSEPEAMSTEQLSIPEISPATVRDLVKVFKLLSDETRLRILFYLSQKEELHVRALCDLLGQSQPAVSHHLALLRVAGLIAPRKAGKHNFYRLQRRRFQRAMEQFSAAVPAASIGGFESQPFAPDNGDAH